MRSNELICSSENTDIEYLKEQLNWTLMDGLELASVVSTNHSYELGDKNSRLRIAVLDFGVKKNILNCLVERGAYVKVFNARAGFDELQNLIRVVILSAMDPEIRRRWIMPSDS